MLTNSNELLGQALGTCTLQRLIGRGGMGAVYLAQQSRPRRTVAVKVLLPGLVEQRPREEFLARFRREADAIASLDHIHIMPIYEYGEQGETAYLVMPYVTGGTLRDRLEQHGILPLPEILQIVEEAASGLDCAHAQGIIHRDLKPGNMLFHADGRLLLADFGLAKVIKEVTENDSGMSVLTSLGTIVGTPEYLSPEQGTGKELDARTDVYSLGVVLYQMLTGRVPFVGVSPVAIAIKHTLEAPPRLTLFNPAIPHSIEAVVMKALAKEPDQRFSSAGELARALRIAMSAKDGTVQWQVATEDLTTPTLHAEQEPAADLASTIPASAPDEPVADASTSETATPTQTTQAQPAETPESIHNAETEASPALMEHLAHREDVIPTLITSAEPTIAQGQQAQALRLVPPAPPVSPMPVPAIRQQQRVAVAEPVIAPVRPVRTRNGLQSVSMMLIGSLLTLLIVAGGLATYLHFKQPPTTRGIVQTHVGSKKITPTISQATATPQTQSNFPAPALSDNTVVGPALYSAVNPGSPCDKQGGQWTNSQDASLTCSADGSVMTNNNTLGSHTAGTFLANMPDNKQLPANFVLQVQVTVNPNAHGAFGFYFHNQAGGSNQGAYAFLVDPASGDCNAYVYDSATGKPTQLNYSPIPLQFSLQGTLTLALKVYNTTYTIYANNKMLGYAESGNQYSGGQIGLAADTGANVTFKNLDVYPI